MALGAVVGHVRPGRRLRFGITRTTTRPIFEPVVRFHWVRAWSSGWLSRWFRPFDLLIPAASLLWSRWTVRRRFPPREMAVDSSRVPARRLHHVAPVRVG